MADVQVGFHFPLMHDMLGLPQISHSQVINYPITPSDRP